MNEWEGWRGRGGELGRGTEMDSKDSEPESMCIATYIDVDSLEREFFAGLWIKGDETIKFNVILVPFDAVEFIGPEIINAMHRDA